MVVAPVGMQNPRAGAGGRAAQSGFGDDFTGAVPVAPSTSGVAFGDDFNPHGNATGTVEPTRNAQGERPGDPGCLLSQELCTSWLGVSWTPCRSMRKAASAAPICDPSS
jgi:hypothetical protein